MSKINKQGLKRAIPEDVKRAVRQRCGFGCVICGDAFIQYDHLSMKFKDARSHDPKDIVLLCASHHARKTSRQLSEETIRKAADKPKALEEGFTFGALDVGTDPPEITLGEMTCTNVTNLFEVDGVCLFSVAPPERLGAPYRVSARLTNSRGVEVLRIVENEFQAMVGNWDFTVIGQVLTIRRAAADIILELRTDPPNRLVVSRLDMRYRRARMSIREGQPTTVVAGGNRFGLVAMSLNGNHTAIRVHKDGIGFASGPGTVRVTPGRSMGMFRVTPDFSTE